MNKFFSFVMVFSIIVLVCCKEQTDVIEPISFRGVHTTVILPAAADDNGISSIMKKKLKEGFPGIIIMKSPEQGIASSDTDVIISTGRHIQTETIIIVGITRIDIGEPSYTKNRITETEYQGILNRTSYIEGKMSIWDIYRSQMLGSYKATFEDVEIHQMVENEEDVARMKNLLKQDNEEREYLYRGIAERLLLNIKD